MKMNKSCKVQTPQAFAVGVPLLRIPNSWCIYKLPIGHSGVHSQQEQLSKAADCAGVNPSPAPKKEGEGIGSWVRANRSMREPSVMPLVSTTGSARCGWRTDGRRWPRLCGGALGWGGERRRRRHYGVPVKLVPLGSDPKRRS